MPVLRAAPDLLLDRGEEGGRFLVGEMRRHRDNAIGVEHHPGGGEPEEHEDVVGLDLDGIAFVEDFVQRYPGAVVVVSHDRRFLDKLIEKLVVFPPAEQGGSPQLVLGNWAEWVRRRGLARYARTA